MEKLRSIQVLRAIAVIAVVHCHAFATGRGSAGVDLFFVISGFIIARVSRDRPAAEFAKARFWRIYPIYFWAVLPPVLWQIRSGSGLTAKVVATLTLWPIWGGEYQQPLLPVAWSLYFEVFFYVAITVWLFSRRAALAAAAGLAILALLSPGPVSGFVLNPLILEFVAGYGLARVQKFPLAAPALVLGCLLLFGSIRQFDAATMLDPMTQSARALLFGVPAVMAVYGALGLERVFGRRSADPLVWIGDASYSIYLMHLYPLNVLAGSSPAMPAIRFAAGLAVGLIVYRIVERPLGAWVAQRRKRLNVRQMEVLAAPA